MWRRCLILLTLLATALAFFVPPTDLPETSYDESESPLMAVVCAPVRADVSVPQQRPVLISHSVTIEHNEVQKTDFIVPVVSVFPPAPPVPFALLC